MGEPHVHALKKLLDSKGLSTGVGDEGGFAPDLGAKIGGRRVAPDAIERAGFTPGADIALALDPATLEIREGDEYVLASEDRRLS